jgi:hypothetical protein
MGQGANHTKSASCRQPLNNQGPGDDDGVDEFDAEFSNYWYKSRLYCTTGEEGQNRLLVARNSKHRCRVQQAQMQGAAGGSAAATGTGVEQPRRVIL